MSGGFQLEAEPFLNVRLAFTHSAKGSVSHYVQDFSPFSTIRELKEDMAAKPTQHNALPVGFSRLYRPFPRARREFGTSIAPFQWDVWLRFIRGECTLAVAAERQVWKLKGKVLQDTQTLDEVEADDGDVIEVASTAE